MKRENSQQTTKRLSAQIARRWRRLNGGVQAQQATPSLKQATETMTLGKLKPARLLSPGTPG